jgi:hypothetical protein
LRLALVGILALLAWRVWPRERLLIRQATWVTHTDQDSPNAYDWLSESELLLPRYRPDTDSFEFRRVDTWTHAETPLATFNQKYRSALHAFTSPDQTTLRVTHYAPRYVLSPDRRWVVLLPICTGGHGDYIVSTPDAVERSRGKTIAGSEVWWLHDNRRWFETDLKNAALSGFMDRLIVYDCQNTGKTTTVHVSDIPFSASEVGITDRDHLLLARWNDKPADSINLYEASVTVPEAAVRKYSVRLPLKVLLRGVAISNDGKRLAWLLQYAYVPPLAAWLHRALPRISAQSRVTQSLWVSRLDGTGMVEVGHLPIADEKEAEKAGNRLLRWLPGGRRLSFLYQDALWTVPVE